MHAYYAQLRHTTYTLPDFGALPSAIDTRRKPKNTRLHSANTTRQPFTRQRALCRVFFFDTQQRASLLSVFFTLGKENFQITF